jgi:hypothetical protein
MPQENQSQRVGVLLVHGIGEQCQFEHLEEVVRNIAAALQADAKRKDSNICSVQVTVNVSKDAPYRAQQQTWRGEGMATATIEVMDKNQQQTDLEFREVWWSDLDEPNSINSFLSFWLWGLSLWTKPRYVRRNDPENPGKELNLHPDRRLPQGNSASKKNLPEAGEPIRFESRIYLFLVSFVVLTLLPFLWILGRVLRSVLGFEVRPDLLVEYLGDVKLYQQDAREGKGPLVDLGTVPPRFSVRRRFIKALVEMSLEEYDRWHILSHSLGTVVAFNGLMEIETALPRYLDQKLWKKWQKHCSDHHGAIKTELTEEQKQAQKNLLPQRPGWLSADDDDMIDRKKLFCKLKGFMTYGSPLSKFAVLWPLVVPLNQDESAFEENFEWINVFDPTDPVSDSTRFFSSKNGENSPLTPKDIAYKADKVHLLSHGQYLTFNPKRKNPLVHQVAQWLLNGEQFKLPQEPENKKDKFFHQLGWPTATVNGKDSPIVSFYFALGVFVWFLLGGVVSTISSYLIPLVLSQIPQLLVQISHLLESIGLHVDMFVQAINGSVKDAISQCSQFLSNSFNYILTIILIVLVVGVIERLLGRNKNRGVPS